MTLPTEIKDFNCVSLRGHLTQGGRNKMRQAVINFETRGWDQSNWRGGESYRVARSPLANGNLWIIQKQNGDRNRWYECAAVYYGEITCNSLSRDQFAGLCRGARMPDFRRHIPFYCKIRGNSANNFSVESLDYGFVYDSFRESGRLFNLPISKGARAAFPVAVKDMDEALAVFEQTVVAA